jgi:hypothetical protein
MFKAATLVKAVFDNRASPRRNTSAKAETGFAAAKRNRESFSPLVDNPTPVVWTCVRLARVAVQKTKWASLGHVETSNLRK